MLFVHASILTLLSLPLLHLQLEYRTVGQQPDTPQATKDAVIATAREFNARVQAINPGRLLRVFMMQGEIDDIAKSKAEARALCALVVQLCGPRIELYGTGGSAQRGD